MLRKDKYKDINKYKKTKNKQQKRYYDKTVNAKRSRMKWTVEEEKLVLEHKIPDRELSQKIQRSQKAISVRRAKLKGVIYE